MSPISPCDESAIAFGNQHSAFIPFGLFSAPALEINVKNSRDLVVWRKAHAVRLASYRGNAESPRQEIYGLVSQIRGCSASIAAE